MRRSAAGLMLAGALGGAAGGGGLSYLLMREAAPPAGSGAPREPLYWVAPMDPSYRRDAPGLSPMGMELAPVYEEDAGGGPGVVSISPVVENNLGVRTGTVEVGPFRSTVRTVGYVRFDEDRLVHMHPRIAGWVDELDVKTQGEFIESGQPVYSIYSPELVNAQEELLIALNGEPPRPTLVRSSEERLRALQVPRALIDRIREERRVFQTVTVHAPQSGLVAELGVREGQYVQPGNAILSIGVLDEVWVIAEVFERQVPLVSAGDPVTMTLDYMPGRAWQGVVDFVYPTLDESTRTVPVRMRFGNPDLALKPNMFAQVTIQHGDESEAVLLLPNESVIRDGVRDRVVLALGEGRFKSVSVVLGRRGDERTEVLEGLMAGDRVVTSAHFLLDSESSIDSDFLRMSARESETDVPPDDASHAGHGGRGA